jgi:hypothetical protein
MLFIPYGLNHSEIRERARLTPPSKLSIRPLDDSELESNDLGTAERRFATLLRPLWRSKPHGTSAQAFLEPLGLTFRQYLVILELLNGAPLSVGSLGTTWAWIQA